MAKDHDHRFPRDAVLFLQCAQSQLDSLFYANLTRENPGPVLVAILNDGGAERQEIDAELGLVPRFPQLEVGFTAIHFSSLKSGGLIAVLAFICKLRPRLVVVQDQNWYAKILIAIISRLGGARIAMRSDKNCLSQNARAGFARWIECQVTRAFFDFLAPVSILSQKYYCWRRMDRVFPFPYPTSAAKFKRNALTTGVRSQIRASLRIPDGAPAFLVVAKFVERENVAGAIAAFGEMSPSAPDAYLVIVGAGPLELELRNLVQRLGLSNVRFVGYVPYAQLHEYFWASDIFVHLAKFEPWGISAQDALVANLKIVTSDRVGSGVVHLKGELSAFLVTGDDPVRAACVMRRALITPEIAFSAAWESASTLFTAEGLAKAWNDLLRRGACPHRY